ncbi:hypothetical protein G9F31_09965 [Acinetobacter sp. 187]|uniref:hypothetical protein n=1 Tax=Acinetobacter lanii TaxID=2715163 RepID=UPI00140B3FE6|nr:hypothetical protein [Acinetobacter lanii]NHC04092.1 hypothetical protein [Acinetobacter lanii]
MSINEEGENLSYYGDNIWDYRAFEPSAIFNFSSHNISLSNIQLIKQVLFLTLYQYNLFPGKILSCKYSFYCLIKIAKVCERHNLLISEISKSSHIHQEIANELQGSTYKVYVNFLHKLITYAYRLNFIIADKKTISFLMSKIENWETIQTPYIPPKIWHYQINRLDECLNDFIVYQDKIEQAFSWLEQTYKSNLNNSFEKTSTRSIFNQYYKANFKDFLIEYKLLPLFEKWLGANSSTSVSFFSTYLNLVRDASLLYILNFSLQRASEVITLRSDCLLIEKDEKIGEISLIIGETTKTDPDSDARWVVPKKIKKAIDTAAFISHLRMQFYNEKVHNDLNGQSSTLLALSALEPWQPQRNYTKNSRGEPYTKVRYGVFISTYPLVFDSEAITINESDWAIALSMTPNLHNKDYFRIGLPWKFAAHQLRRTTTINMFSSHMVSDKSLQWSMKHLNHIMTLYYGRNYTNLKLNSEVETEIIIESYNKIYHQLIEVITDDIQHVRPHNRILLADNIINLIENKEEQQLKKLIKQGLIGCRATLLGYCMKPGSCEYGGIESVVKCIKSDGGGICTDAIFKTKNRSKLIYLKESHEKQLALLDSKSPRFNSIKHEIHAIEVYLNVINKAEC